MVRVAFRRPTIKHTHNISCKNQREHCSRHSLQCTFQPKYSGNAVNTPTLIAPAGLLRTCSEHSEIGLLRHGSCIAEYVLLFVKVVPAIFFIPTPYP